MRYAEIKLNDSVNGMGVNLSLWVQGCPIRCEGCHNESIWDFNGGLPFTKEVEDYIINVVDNKTERNLSVLGGEPLSYSNILDLLGFFKRFKETYPDKKIFLWTGYTFENLTFTQRMLLHYVDVLIDGKYIEEEKQLQLKLRGSKNQRIIMVQETLKLGRIVEMEG